MQYLCLDFGGSAMKYAVMNNSFEIIHSGSVPSLKMQNKEQLIDEVIKLYEQYKPDGGIAISYCGELDETTGYLFSGGSYAFMKGENLKKELGERCNCPVSVENDGNCAGIAEIKRGVLQPYSDCMVLVIGTGIAGAIMLDGKVRHGKHAYAGSESFLAADITKPFSHANMAAGYAGARYLGNTYAKLKGLSESIDGRLFFDHLNESDKEAQSVIESYMTNLANLIFNLFLTLDLEAFAIGGGISVQPAFERELQKAFDSLYDDPFIRMIDIPKPKLHICRFHNDANLIGALCHHIDHTGS